MTRGNCRAFKTGPALPALMMCCGAAAGPVVVSGDAADSHAAPAAYSGLLHQLLANTTNGQTGILALGADVESQAAEWILGVAAALPQPQPVAFVNDQTLLVIGFSGYAALYVPSDSGSTPGGINADENGYLALRAADIAQFIGAGGGLLGLTQGQLDNPYAYLGAYAPVQSSSVPGGDCAPEQPYDDVSATPTGAFLGISDASLDGCCWRGVFDSFPESLVPLAKVNEPACDSINGKAALLGGFVQIGFDPPSEFLAAGEPKLGALGDLDGEGTLDVTVSIPGPDPSLPGSIQVFLNQGTVAAGEWQGLLAKPPVTVGKEPGAIAAGLFNADPHLDLAVANAGDDTLSILINDGSGGGTFLPPVTIPVGHQPSAVVAADFNRDTFVDLAVAHELDQDFIVLLNDGDGNFGSGEPPPPMGINPVGMSSGDFDGNKDPDLAGGGSGSVLDSGGVPPGFAFVALGNGDGTFAPPALYPVGTDPRDLAVADFDGDGLPDIVTANHGDGTLSLLQNTGGTFATAIPIPVGAAPTAVDAADLDGDLDPDLAAVAIDPDIGPSVDVLVNTSGTAADISFQAPLAFPVNADPRFVLTGKMDDDDLPDVITANVDSGPTGGSVSVLVNAPAVIDVPEELAAFFDIRPNGCPNPLNPDSHGLLPAALVGSDTFDVEQVKLESLVLARADGVGSTIQPIGFDGLPLPPFPGEDPTPQFGAVTSPFSGEPCDCDVLGPDGILDLKLKFRTDKLVSKLQLNALPHGTQVKLVLSGELLDGTTFSVTDCVVIAPPKGPPGLLSVAATAPGAFIDVSPPDKQLDDGGFAPFQRMFPPGTVVTLTAPPLHEGQVFVGWKLQKAAASVAGAGQLIPGNALSLTVSGQHLKLQAVYVKVAPG